MLTITSLEVAEITGKMHKDVMKHAGYMPCE